MVTKEASRKTVSLNGKMFLALAATLIISIEGAFAGKMFWSPAYLVIKRVSTDY